MTRCLELVAIACLGIVLLQSSVWAVENVCAVSGEGDCDGEVPIQGFVKAKSGSLGVHSSDYWLALRTLSKVPRSPLCRALAFVNLPKPNASPLVGDNHFRLDSSRLINDKFFWSNGHESLSFVPHTSGGHDGNWLVGATPGEDSGYVFLETSDSALSPQDIESHSWKWLQHGQWVDQPDMSMRCLDERSIDHFFEVEYFEPRDKTSQSYQPKTALLLTDINTRDLVDAGFELSPKKLAQRADRIHALLDVTSRRAHLLTDLQPIFSVGSAVRVTHDESPHSAESVLVNVEHFVGGWKLTFRQLWAQSNSSSTTTSSATSSPQSAIAGVIRIDTPRAAHIESAFDLSAVGTFSSTSSEVLPKPLTRSEQSARLQTLRRTLSSVQVGDYLWLWYREDSMANGQAKPSALKHKVFDIVAVCVARHGQTLLFEYHLAHRQEVMKRSVLSQTIDLLSMDLSTSDEVLSASMGSDQRILIQEIEFLGNRPIDLVIDFIKFKEKRLGVSACFMYHAAYSLPQPFLYANEILCVLVGAKPVTMIQYASPSEHQWKFLLVKELSRAIVAAERVFGDAFPLNHEIFTREKDDTLVIFHRDQRHLMNALRPPRSAQALHPMPFIDDSSAASMIQTAEEQVYNSAFNGLALGYPERFVSSYCEGLVGDRLSLSAKLEQFEFARSDFLSQFGQLAEIGVGWNDPVPSAHLDFIRQQIHSQ